MRSARILSATALVLVAVSGCADEPVTDPVAAGLCDPVERPALQQGSHLIGTNEPPVPYSSSPPTSGWHASGRGPTAGVYGVVVPDQQLVSVLERGGVVLAHDDQLDDTATADLLAAVGEVGDLVVTRYELPEEDRPIALAAWGVLQRCDVVDVDTVIAFADAHAGDDRHG